MQQRNAAAQEEIQDEVEAPESDQAQ